MNDKFVGDKLKMLRKGRKLTQEEAAEKLGLVRATISNYETGRRSPHLKELKRFAEFYGVSLEFFGISSTDEVFELLCRARKVFESNEIPAAEKEDLYKELLKLYLNIK